MTAPLTCPLCGLSDGVGPAFCACPYEDLQAALREARREISEASPKWTSVEERLPPNVPGAHLTFNGRWIVVETALPCWWNRRDERGQEFDGPTVTHWMPLPAPPLAKNPNYQRGSIETRAGEMAPAVRLRADNADGAIPSSRSYSDVPVTGHIPEEGK